MKELYTLLIACLLLASLGSCQNEKTEQEAVGYLMLQVGTDKTTLTKAEDTYNPKQIAVKIVNSAGKTVKETDDCTTWTEAIELPVGTYTIEASSAGFDGKTAGWDKPYYAAKETVDIKMNTNTSKEIVCKLANVLVTVEFSDDFRAAFQSAVVGVSDKSNSDNKVTFEMRQSSETGKAYFPVTDLISNLTVSNHKGELHSKKDTITGIKAQENVILRYRIASSGSSNIGVTVDDATKTYTYTIGVPVTATNTLIVSANAWSTFAYLTGEVPSFADVFDQSKLEFQYKTADAAEWTKVATEMTVEEKDKKFATRLTGLTPATAYQCRLYYNDGSEEGITSEAVDFTTEAATPLPNGSFEDWYQSSKTWYPVSEADFANNLFWDSGNNSLAAMFDAYLCQEDPDTKGVAYLSANMVLGSVFAPGNMYVGDFSMNGTMGTANFGKVFGWTARPTALKVSYKANVGLIDKEGASDPEKGNYKDKQDTTRIYAVVIDWTEQHPVISGMGEPTGMWDPSTAASLEEGAILGYAILDITADQESFTDAEIPFVWYDTVTKPAEGNYSIVISCATSKRGDYLTGCSTNKLWVDNFEFVY